MFVVIWEFHVREASEVEFERLYGREGDWSDLFRKAEGWLGTEMLRDETSVRRYITIDRWESAGAYRQFKQDFRQAYDALDARCQALTESETGLGMFVMRG